MRYSRIYSKQKAKEAREQEMATIERLNEIDDIILNGNAGDDILTEYQNLKTTLEQVEDRKVRGASIRSRQEIIEMNEKSNNFFFRQEKLSSSKK